MASVKPRVKVPDTANAGEPVTIKTLISHPMETGLRKDDDGNPIPRMIIHTFRATFNGQEIISVDVEPGVSANPYFEFDAMFNESGTIVFEWMDDSGETFTAESEISVS